MKNYNVSYYSIPGFHFNSTTTNTPSEPQRNDPFRRDEEDNDATRIRPGVHEPEKNDPTKIDIPSIPTIPTPGEEA